MMVLRFLTGIGLGAAMPNTMTLVAEYVPQRRRSLLITTMFIGFGGVPGSVGRGDSMSFAVDYAKGNSGADAARRTRS